MAACGILRSVVSGAACALLPVMSAAAGGLSVTDARVTEAPPGTGVNAGYLDISNAAGEDLALVGVSSPRFERVEMHLSEVRDGMAAMQRRNSVVIPAGQTVRFAPGGYHLMLFGPDRAPRAGETVTLMLRFSDGTEIESEAPVRRPGAGHGRHRH